MLRVTTALQSVLTCACRSSGNDHYRQMVHVCDGFESHGSMVAETMMKII
jgi:hypothetical protein